MTDFVRATQCVGLGLSWQFCLARALGKTGAANRGRMTGTC